MAAFESLRSLFEKPLTDHPTLMESLSWNQIKSVKPPDDAAFTEIFGELHFEERRPPADADPSLHASLSTAVAATGSDPAPSTSPWSPVLDRSPALDGKDENLRRNGGESWGSSPGSFRSSGGGDCFPLNSLLGMSSTGSSPRGKDAHFQRSHADSFHLCTEGLGFESSDDVEYSRSESSGERCCQMNETGAVDGTPRPPLPEVGYNGCPKVISGRRPRTMVEFPPPITCIGSVGKPCFWLSSHREGGRFVLREVPLPHRVLLHASRKDGRLKLQFVQPDEEIIEEDEDEEKGGGGEEEEIIEEEEEEEAESSEEGDEADGDAEE